MSFTPSPEITQLLKEPIIKKLLVTDAQANMQVDFPIDMHPSRMRFLGDSLYAHHVTLMLMKKYPVSQAGGLTKMRADSVSSGAFSRYYDIAGFEALGLNLRNEKPKEKVVEALIGLAYTCFEWDISALIVKDMEAASLRY